MHCSYTSLLWLLIYLQLSIQFDGHTYWNNRYSGESEFTSYSSDDASYGLWSLGHGYSFSSYPSGSVCSGCFCNDTDNTVSLCNSASITLSGKPFKNISPETFPNPDAVTSISIYHCSEFEKMHNRNNMAFDFLTNLRQLKIHHTSIREFPDISATALQKLSLIGNNVRFFTANSTSQTLPSALTHVALAHNNIAWIPDDAFSDSNIQILSLSYNNMEFFPTKAVRNLANLTYLGVDGNQIRSISKANMASLMTSPIQHLNLSNNDIFFIERFALSQLRSLCILELHRNKFVTVPVETIHDMPSLLHLDLNNNNIASLGTEALTNMPHLITLKLHSQNPGLHNIEFNAFKNINDSLKYL